MIKEKIGEVTEAEKEYLLLLFERKSALKELLMSFNNLLMSEQSKDDLHIKIDSDMDVVTSEYDKWWQDMTSKYLWRSSGDEKYEINFITNEIFILNNV